MCLAEEHRPPVPSPVPASATTAFAPLPHRATLTDVADPAWQCLGDPHSRPATPPPPAPLPHVNGNAGAAGIEVLRRNPSETCEGEPDVPAAANAANIAATIAGVIGVASVEVTVVVSAVVVA